MKKRNGACDECKEEAVHISLIYNLCDDCFDDRAAFDDWEAPTDMDFNN